ncbi:MAG: ABC transporter substrate-binding protein [Candidatus Accumulibacter sp.]|jgi:NitT/TauT family transport system substrate-binding protein|nr:ABC transporter substrate-binding protein [Accumulibacter sp.]
MKKLLLAPAIALTVCASAVFTSGAATAQPLEKVEFLLNWTISSDHSPYYIALEKGWFKEEGLDVNVTIGQGSGYAVQAVDAGKADISIADAPTPFTLRQKGAKVKIIGVIFDKNPCNAYFWKDTGIKTPKDFAGKTIAVPATDGHKVMWPAFAKIVGVDPGSVRFINIEPAAKAAALASRKADILFELYTTYPQMSKGVPAGQLGNIIWADHGYDIYAHSYITSDDTAAKRPETLKKFLKAAYRAWEYALTHPEEAIEILSKYHPINRADYLESFKIVQDVFKTDRYKNNGIGFIDPGRMQKTWDLVNEYQAPLSYKVTDIYDAGFLPNPMYKYNF